MWGMKGKFKGRFKNHHEFTTSHNVVAKLFSIYSYAYTIRYIFFEIGREVLERKTNL